MFYFDNLTYLYMSRILFLTANLSSGGAERQMVTVASLLNEQGFIVEVLCYGKGDFYSYILNDNNIPIYWNTEDNYLLRILRVRKFIRRGNYNAVISFLEMPNFLNCLSSIGGNDWKVITGERSSKKRTFLSKKGKIFAWFRRFSNYIVCNSDNARKMWIEYYPQFSNKLITIYNNVQLPVISSEYIPKRDDKLHIVIAASYQYLKNPIGVVKALSLLNEIQRKKICVNWYGQIEIAKINSRPYDEAVKLISENNLEGTIYLNKPTTDIANIMNAADFVGLFSELEGLPNAVCEAMLIGKPIIMTRVSDYAKLVDDTNGFLCDWDNPESIKDAFVSAINLNEEKLRSMSENSKKKAESFFSKEKVLSSWLELLK
ncbi:alpha-1,4-N-acetyl-D-galactosaminyltransferase [compost metagenome]